MWFVDFFGTELGKVFFRGQLFVVNARSWIGYSLDFEPFWLADWTVASDFCCDFDVRICDIDGDIRLKMDLRYPRVAMLFYTTTIRTDNKMPNP